MAPHQEAGRRSRSTAGTPRSIRRSVKTGRTNDEVKANRDALWVSNMPAATAEIDLAGADRATDARVHPADARHARLDSRSAIRTGCSRSSGMATGSRRSSTAARSGPTRARDSTARDVLPGLAASPGSWIEADQAIVDGEVVALDENGAPDFSLLQEGISNLRAGNRNGAGSRNERVIVHERLVDGMVGRRGRGQRIVPPKRMLARYTPR